MSERIWTPSQSQAIHYDQPHNLLISAAAGSGKTAVLTERVFVRAALSGAASLDQILVLTFTEKAAASMKQRIEQRFRQALKSTDDPVLQKRIREQLRLLPNAWISTVHAFCRQVIQAHLAELTDSAGKPLLQAGFETLDAAESRLILDQAVDTVLENAYLTEALHSDFQRLAQVFDRGSQDASLRSALVAALGELRSRGNYQEWVSQRLAIWDQEAANFEASDTAESYLKELAANLRIACAHLEDPFWTAAVDHLAELVRTKQTTSREISDFVDCWANQRQVFPGLLAQLQAGGPGIWQQVRQLASQLAPPVFLTNRRTAGLEPEEKRLLRAAHIRAVAPVTLSLLGQPTGDSVLRELEDDSLPTVFTASAAAIEADMQRMSPLLHQFFQLVFQLDEEARRLRLARNSVDFSDYEHDALRLLRQPEVARAYQAVLRDVYLDEYQDTSSIQEEIVNCLISNNSFLVGDIKQSIYRFRHANPNLFWDKLTRFRPLAAAADAASAALADAAGGAARAASPDAAGILGQVLHLNQNFRSEPRILDFVNRWFAGFLTVESGQIDYDETQLLLAWQEANPAVDEPVRLLLLDLADAEELAEADDAAAQDQREPDFWTKADEASPAALFGQQALDPDLNRAIGMEALLAVKEIYRLVHTKAAEFGEIAILLRNNSYCETYRKVLARHGIPVSQPATTKFLDTPALRLMEALVQVLDNQQQDIPLAAVLLSELGSWRLTEADLLAIRRAAQLEQSREQPVFFHQRVAWYRTQGDDPGIRSQLELALGQLSAWRQLAAAVSLAELLETILRQGGLLDRLPFLEQGEQWLSDINQLIEWIRQLELKRPLSLSGLAALIRSYREKDVEVAGFGEVSADTNVVQILTMHGSKGLEFPVVLVGGLYQELSPQPEKHDVLLMSESDLTCLAVDPAARESHLIPRHHRHLQRIQFESFAESLRLLYVAVTRAERQLILLATPARGWRDQLDRLIEMIEDAATIWDGQNAATLPANFVRRARSALQLILSVLAKEHSQQLIALLQRETSRCVLPELVVARISLNEVRDSLQAAAVELLPSGAGESPPVTAILADPKSVELPVAIPADPESVEPPIAEGARAVSDHRADLAATETDLQDPADVAAAARIAAWLDPTPQRPELLLAPSKLSVSELKRLADQQLQAAQADVAAASEERSADPAALLIRDITTVLRQPLLTGPRVIEQTALGTLLHTVFQFLDLPALPADPTEEHLQAQLSAMVKNKQLAAVDLPLLQPFVPAMLAFARSEVAAEIQEAELAGPGRIFREMPFTISIPAPGVPPAWQEITLVQGIIDLWYHLPDKGVTLLDFKSDRLTGTAAEQDQKICERYAVQLAYYAEAIRRAIGHPVDRRWVWLIREARIVEVPATEIPV